MIPLINVPTRRKLVLAWTLIMSIALLAGFCPIVRAANWTWDVGRVQCGTGATGSASVDGDGKWNSQGQKKSAVNHK
jgi:hypothetical protein